MRSFFRPILPILAWAFPEPALWQGQTVVGRFWIDPYEQALGGIDPGLSVTQIWFRVDRAVMPQPWPVIGDHLTIRGQVYEVVHVEEDDLGEQGYRLLREELGIATVISEGDTGDNGFEIDPAERRGLPHPAANHAGRPSRRTQVARVFREAVDSGALDPARPFGEVLAFMRQRVGHGQGLSDSAMRRILRDCLIDERGRMAAR